MTEASPLLDQRVAQFAERNMVLWLALGGLSYARKLDELLERHGQADPTREPVANDDEMLMAVLGLVAFARRLEAVLEQASVAPEPPPDASPPDASPLPVAGLLR